MFAPLIPLLVSAGASVLANHIGTDKEQSVIQAVSKVFNITSPTLENLTQSLTNVNPEQQIAILKENNDFAISQAQQMNAALQNMNAINQTKWSSNTDQNIDKMRMQNMWVIAFLCVFVTSGVFYLVAKNLLDSAEWAIVGVIINSVWSSLKSICEFLWDTGIKSAMGLFTKGDKNAS